MDDYKITITVDVEIYVQGAKGTTSLPIELNQKEVEQLVKDGFFQMDKDAQRKYLMDKGFSFTSSKDGNKYSLKDTIESLESDPNIIDVVPSVNDEIELEINGEKVTLSIDDYEEFSKNPQAYAQKVYENKQIRDGKVADKLARDEEFYKNNAYNQKYVARASDINNIMLDEEDYEKVMNNMKKNEASFENAKTSISAAADTASSNNFSCASQISGHTAVIDSIKTEETQLTNRLKLSITVLKNCDMEMSAFLENMLVGAIFSKDMKDHEYHWETIENDLDSILTDLENEIQRQIDEKKEYAANLWNFKKYYDAKTGKWLFPDDMSPEDIALVQRSMSELSKLPWTKSIRYGNLWKGGIDTYNGSVFAFLYEQDYSMWKAGNVSTLNDFSFYMQTSSGTETTTLLEYFLNDNINSNEINKRNYPYTIELSKKYATLVSEANELNKALSTMKAIHTKVPYIKYSMEDDYKNIYNSIRSSKVNSEGELPVNEILKANGLDTKYADKMKFMTVNEMSTYIYLLKHNGESGVKSPSDYKDKLYKTTLKQREADYTAYDELAKLIADGKIDAGEIIGKTLDGFGDGFASWWYGFARAFSPCSDDGYKPDELKEMKLAELLATYPCGSDKETTAAMHDFYKLAYEQGAITKRNWEAVDSLYSYVTNNSVAYSEIATYQQLYNGAKGFSSKVPTIAIAIVGKALSTYTCGISDAVATIINGIQQFGENCFKEWQSSGDVAGSVLNGIFGALNSMFINKFAGKVAGEIVDSNSFVQLMSRTLTRESIKSFAKTLEDTVVNLAEGNCEVEINIPKFIKNIDNLVSKSIPNLRDGKITWVEFLYDCVDVVEPYLFNLILNGTTFDGKKNGLKAKGQETADNSEYMQAAGMAMYMTKAMERLRAARSAKEDKK